MKILAKGKKYNVIIKYRSYMDFYEVEIAHENRERMGKINFKIKDRETWIYSIYTEEKYQHMGIGKALLEICEYLSSLKRVKLIEGKFFPTNEYARPLYEKNGYSINKESYETFITKHINAKETRNRLADKIIDDDGFDYII